MFSHEMLCHIEAEPGAFELVGIGAVDLREGFENAGDIPLSDDAAGIRHGEFDPVIR